MITADAQDRLERFAALLRRWNRTLNLVAARDVPVLWERHIADSLQLGAMMPPGISRAVDLGSGGGFPGLVLAIATGVHFDLIESDQRKASFLRSAVLETKAPAAVHACRIEDAPVAPAPLVTARALAPLPRLLPMAVRLLAKDGVCLLLKGASVEQELALAHQDWLMSVTRTASSTGGSGVVLKLSGVRARTLVGQ